MTRLNTARLMSHDDADEPHFYVRWPRKDRPAGSPSELRSVVSEVVKRFAGVHKANAIHSAVVHRIQSINEERLREFKLPKPSKGLVKHLLHEHRQRMSVAEQLPEEAVGRGVRVAHAGNSAVLH